MSRNPYHRPVSTRTWYFRLPRYRNYMLREATCLLVAIYCGLLLVALAALGNEQASEWERLLAAQQHPAWLLFHAFSLVYFCIYQTAAWFRLAPKAMPVQLAGRSVPDSAVILAHYLLWILLTLAVFYLAGVV